MGMLDALRTYRGKWAVKSIESLSADDINSVASATVVPSEFGQSVCMTLKSGGQKFVPVSNTSRAVQNGEHINLADAKMVTLGRDGDNDIYRLEVK